MSWYLEVLKKYAVFSGRARRREYWFFALFHSLAILVLVLIDFAIGISEEGIGILSGLYILGTFVPALAVTVRRLHDTGRSGWWILLQIVPLVGAIVLLVFSLQDSHPGANQYGESPKAEAASTQLDEQTEI